MAFSKAPHYDKDEQLAAAFFQAFAHPARQRIIKQLCQYGPTRVQDLGKEHPLADSTLSDHLRILRVAGLVSFVEEYPYTIYSVDEEMLVRGENYIACFFQSLYTYT